MPSLTFSLPWLRPGDARQELWARARRGDGAALDTLVSSYRERIVNLCFQILRDHDLAEDSAQEAFILALTHMGQFRGDADFGTWLYKVAANHSLQRIRVLNRRHQLAPTSALQEWETGSSADFTADVARRSQLEAVMDKLPEPLRLALILREWHDLSYAEMASVLEVPVGTVRSRLHEARSQFRHLWEELEK